MLVRCSDFDVEVSEGEVVYCYDYGEAFCKECRVLGACSKCVEALEADKDLEAEEVIGLTKDPAYKVFVVYH